MSTVYNQRLTTIRALPPVLSGSSVPKVQKKIYRSARWGSYYRRLRKADKEKKRADKSLRRKAVKQSTPKHGFHPEANQPSPSIVNTQNTSTTEKKVVRRSVPSVPTTIAASPEPPLVESDALAIEHLYVWSKYRNCFKVRLGQDLIAAEEIECQPAGAYEGLVEVLEPANDKYHRYFQQYGAQSQKPQSPYLVGLRALYHNKGLLHVVHEWMDMTLGQLLATGLPLAQDEILAIRWKLARALEELHRYGLVHRKIELKTIWLNLAGDLKIAHPILCDQAFTNTSGAKGSANDKINHDQAQKVLIAVLNEQESAKNRKWTLQYSDIDSETRRQFDCAIRRITKKGIRNACFRESPSELRKLASADVP